MSPNDQISRHQRRFVKATTESTKDANAIGSTLDGNDSRPAINVLYVVVHGDMGGVHRFLDSVLRRHSKKVRPVVLSFREGPWLGELRNHGISVYCINNGRLRNPIRIFREVRKIIDRERIEIIHSAYSWCHSLVAPAGAWSRCRLMWFHHGPIGEGRWQGVMNMVPASLLLTNSNFMAARLARTFHGARRFGVVHYGIDAANFAPNLERRAAFRNQWRIGDDTIAVGIVGFLDVWKGQDIFLQAAKILSNQNLKTRMIIVGGPRDGQSAERCETFERRLRSYARENGIEDQVVFTGHVDVRAGALDGLDVFVHASSEPEPFGAVILEAMCKGKPIIASAEGGPLEMVTDGFDGLLIEPRSPRILATAIHRLVNDPELRERLSVGALVTARTKFDPDASARKLENWYEQLVG